MSELVTSVVRFDSPYDWAALDRCLFALACQTYSSLQVMVSVDRSEVQDRVSEVLAKQPWPEPRHHIDVRAAGDSSNRSPLSLAKGRYLSLLTCHDLLYQYAYESAVLSIEKSGLPVAAFNYRWTLVEGGTERALPTKKKSAVQVPKTRLDLFWQNLLIPGALLIDRRRVSDSALVDLSPDSSLILELARQYELDLSLLSTPLADRWIYNRSEWEAAGTKSVEPDPGTRVSTSLREVQLFIEERQTELLTSTPVYRAARWLETSLEAHPRARAAVTLVLRNIANSTRVFGRR